MRVRVRVSQCFTFKEFGHSEERVLKKASKLKVSVKLDLPSCNLVALSFVTKV